MCEKHFRPSDYTNPLCHRLKFKTVSQKLHDITFKVPHEIPASLEPIICTNDTVTHELDTESPSCSYTETLSYSFTETPSCSYSNTASETETPSCSYTETP